MKTIRTSKQLTFLYFSIVACAIIAIHASVLEITTEEIEHLYAYNRLVKISHYAQQTLPERTIKKNTSIDLQTQGKTDFDPFVKVYFDSKTLPPEFPAMEQLPYNQSIEVRFEEEDRAFFMMKIRTRVNATDSEPKTEEIDALIVIDNSLYEFSEEQFFSNQTIPVIISLSLLIVSLFVVLKISEHLTRPISLFAQTLANRSPNNLEAIALPTGTYTKELLKLIETFNRYQSRLHSLLERERSFNRYISHELRSPLMVMQGAITLLDESHQPEFVEKQKQRMRRATKEMEEFIETLLSLSKSTEKSELTPRPVKQEELEHIVSNHLHLLQHKSLEWNIYLTEPLYIRMPEAAFHILLGNLIKNAFLYTRQGQVDIYVDSHNIQVIDTGQGFHSHHSNPQGFGLGLLLVKDICHRYDWSFNIQSNTTKEGKITGCTATIQFSQQDLSHQHKHSH